MDPLIASLGGELVIPGHVLTPQGIVWQPEPDPHNYGPADWDECRTWATTDVAERTHDARVELVVSHGCANVLDVGVGSGQFVQWFDQPNTGRACFGFDVNPIAVGWLKESGRLFDPFKNRRIWGDGACCWGVLQHMHNPQEFLKLFVRRQFLFVSLPVYNEQNIVQLEQSQHFKNEHVLYFTPHGLSWYLAKHGFTLLQFDRRENKSGREGIGSFVFVKS